MKKVIFPLLITFFVSFGALAKTLDQKKAEIKKIYEAGGISKIEYNKAQEFLENSKEKTKEKKLKQAFHFSKKKNSKAESVFNKYKKDKDKEKITLKKIEELGPIIKLDDTYFPDGMIKKFKGCSNSFKCKGGKAGQQMSKVFRQGKRYGQRHPGKMIKAMAMFEVFFAERHWSARKAIERYKENNYNDYKNKKKKISLSSAIYSKAKDERAIRSLLGMMKGKKGMREALGMSLETPTKEAIAKFWVLGDFLDLGTATVNKKLSPDLKKRKELLESYRTQVVNLRKKIQDDLDEEENEKSAE